MNDEASRQPDGLSGATRESPEQKIIPERLSGPLPGQTSEKGDEEKRSVSLEKSEVEHHAGRTHELVEAGRFGQQLVAVSVGGGEIKTRAF